MFGEIKTLLIDDEVWFVSKNIAETLGYEKRKLSITIPYR